MAKTKFVKTTYMVEDEAVEKIAEVPVETWPKLKPVGDYVGKSQDRVDGYDKVSGAAKYTFDIQLPNMIHAKVLRSPHAYAEILEIDSSEAEAMPGVLAVMHHANSDRVPWYYGISSLFDQTVRFVGDEVAGIAAISEDIAEEAMKKIKVTYSTKPFGVEPDKIIENNEPRIHFDNVLQGRQAFPYERGNMDEGFNEAEVIAEGTYRTPVLLHNPTEGHCSVCVWKNNQLEVWETTQSIFRVRDQIVQTLQMPASRIQIHSKYMGGGFGSKLTLSKHTIIAALLSQKTGRPVRLALDRREVCLCVGNRPDSIQKVRIGAKKDGTLTAMSQETIGQVGAFPNGADARWPWITMYRCPNVYTSTRNVYTNAGPGRAFRAPGDPQAFFSLDQTMDELAEKLGMDTLELMKKNYTDVDQVYGRPYSSKKLMECYDWGAEQIGWQNRKPAGSDEGPVKRGIGMASQIWRAGDGALPAGATCKLNSDGSVYLITGTQDIGTGTATALTQIVAEELEVPFERIKVSWGHSSGPVSPPSGGSLTIPSLTPAVLHACQQVKQAVLEAVAAQWETGVENVWLKDGVVRGPEDKTMTLAEAAQQTGEGTIIRHGLRSPNPEGFTINPFGAHFAEVEVDTRTGRIRVLRMAAAHDIGRVINPKTAINQVHGGIIMAIGFALMEERVMDKQTGAVLTTNLHDYKLPTVKDAPEIEVYFVPYVDERGNGTGVKGLGEPPHIPVAAAIANAVYNATGVRMYSLPMSPDRVLTALSKA